MIHRCPHCPFETPYRHVLKKHLQRKRPCTCASADQSSGGEPPSDSHVRGRPKADTTCPRCGKVFSRHQHMMRHMATCAPAPPAESTPGVQELQARVTELEELCRRLLEAQLRHTPVTSVTTNNNTTTNNNNTTTNITTTNNNTTTNISYNINALFNEDISYISEEALETLVRQQNMGVVKMIRDVHFHPHHPENHNIRLKSSKNKQVQVFDGTTWKTDVLDDVLNKVTCHWQTRLVTNTSAVREDPGVATWNMEFNSTDAKVKNDAKTRTLNLMIDHRSSLSSS